MDLTINIEEKQVINSGFEVENLPLIVVIIHITYDINPYQGK